MGVDPETNPICDYGPSEGQMGDAKASTLGNKTPVTATRLNPDSPADGGVTIPVDAAPASGSTAIGP